tara:strand:+ start:12763 stop:13872 length:1110 start_codon:yes stop_codon:yes gene_type:complete
MENNELGMGLFGEGQELEVNFDLNPEEVLGDIVPEEEIIPAAVAEEDDLENINSNEDEDPEIVVGDEDPEGSGADTSPNLFSSFASELHSKGVLPSLDLDKSKIENTDGLASAIKGEIDTQVKDYIVSKIGEDGFDALEKGVSLSNYQEHINNVETLDSIDEEALSGDLDLAKRVILQDYINQGLSEDRAKRILQKTIDNGDESVLEDAKESISSLKVFEANRIEVEKVAAQTRATAAVQAQEKIDNDLKNAIYNKKSIIEGIEVNKTIQDKVYQSITKVVGQSPEGVMENRLMQDRRENPIEFDSKLYYLYELTNGFEDFSQLKNKATSKAASDFERALRQTKFESSGQPSFTEDKDSYEGMGTELVL